MLLVKPKAMIYYHQSCKPCHEDSKYICKYLKNGTPFWIVSIYSSHFHLCPPSNIGENFFHEFQGFQ